MHASPTRPTALLIGSFLLTFIVSFTVAGVAAFMVHRACHPIVNALVGETSAVATRDISTVGLQSLFWIAICIAWLLLAFQWQRSFRQNRDESAD